MKTPLRLGASNAVAPAVYAELLVVAARISNVHGNMSNAIEELDGALWLDSTNSDIEPFMMQCRKRQWSRHERLEAAQKAQGLIFMTRTEGM